MVSVRPNPVLSISTAATSTMRRTNFLKRAVAAIFILTVFMMVLRITRSPAVNSHATQSTENHPKADGKDGSNVNLREKIQHQDLMNDVADSNVEKVEAPEPPSEEELKAIEEQMIAEGKKVYESIVGYSSVPPVIIFSKSYCPHSKRAKQLLLEDYVIQPTPLVIELDIITNGDKLQKYLHKLTGQRTVPNIMIDGVSRGGASDMAELGDDLPEKFLEWGSRKFTIRKA